MTENQHEQLVREYAELEARIGPDLARMDEIKKYLRGDLDYGSHEISGCKVSIGRNARFNAKRFEAAYPPVEYPQYYKPAPNTAAIKDDLSANQLREFQDEGDPRVTIK